MTFDDPMMMCRSDIEHQISAMERRARALRIELERRGSTDKEVWGVPFTGRAYEGGPLRTFYKLYDTAVEAYDNAKKVLDKYEPGNDIDDYTARYRVIRLFK